MQKRALLILQKMQNRDTKGNIAHLKNTLGTIKLPG